MTIATLCTGLPIAHAQAAMRGAAVHASDITIAKPDSGLTVSQIRGQAFRIKAGGVYVALRRGGILAPGEPVGVGGKSRMDLGMGNDGVLELGPGARLLVPSGTDSGKAKVATALRLEQGYLRVLLKGDEARAARLDVSFGRWSASMEPGEYMFDAREPESSVCTVSGMLHLSGVPEGTPTSVSSGCLLLGAQTPATVTLAPADWKRVQDRRALQPVVAEVNWREVKAALARVEADFAGKANRKSSEGVSAARLSDDDAKSPTRIETREVVAIPEPLQRLPRTRASAIAVPRPVSLAALDAMVRRVDRQIAREQARLAEALVASATPIPRAALVETPSSAAAPTPADMPRQPLLAAEVPRQTPTQSQDAAPAARVESASVPAAGKEGAAPPDIHAPGLASSQSAMPAPLPRPRAPNLQLALDAGLGTLESDASGGAATVSSPSGDGTALVYEQVHAPEPARQVEAHLRSPSPPGSQIDVGAHGTPQIANAVLSNPAPASPADPLAGSHASAQATPQLEWIVNVASFPSLESAQRQAEQLRSQNLASGIRSETVRGRSAYRVVIEGLATEEAANAVLRELVSRLGLRQAWAFRKS